MVRPGGSDNVSALLTGGGTADMAVQLILQGAATLLVDSRLLAEYDEVTAHLP